MSVLIVRADSESDQFAKVLANSLGVQLVRQKATIDPSVLFVIDVTSLEGADFDISLCLPHSPKIKPFRLDFNSARKGGVGKDPLLRAIGPNVTNVVDMTPGWCTDTLHLVRKGMNVTAVEANKVVFCMINHAKHQLKDTVLQGKINLISGNSIDWLDREKYYSDVVYLDPMYPAKNKSAATRKELVILQALNSCFDAIHHDNNERLFHYAMQYAKKRLW